MTGPGWIERLPAELSGQKQIMRRLLAVCEGNARIRWLAVGCSLGRGNADRLSDLDMALGVRDEDFDAVIGEVRAAVDGLASLVESYHHQLPGVSGQHERIFAQYADRCQLDLVVFPASTDIGRGPSIVVLYDPDDAIVVTSERPAPTPPQVREWAFRAWCVLADLGKYVRRGSVWEALECLQEARTNFWRLLAVAHAVPDPQYGIVSLLDFAPGLVPAEMADAVPDFDLGRVLAAARVVARHLSGIGASLPAELSAALPGAMAAFIARDLDVLAADVGATATS
jgi:hypothetical protein